MRFLLLLPLVLLSGCIVSFGEWWSDSSRVWIESTEEFTVEASQLTSVRATAHNGPVRARGDGDGAEVHVVVQKRVGGADARDAERALEALEIEREIHDGELELGWRWSESRRRRWNANIAFQVEMPAGLGLGVETHNGAVRVTGVDGPVAVESHNGRIEVEGAPHSLSLTSHNGRLHADLRRASKIVGTFESHNGPVTVLVGEAASTRVRCITHRGAIGFGVPVTGRSGGRYDVRATIGAGDGRLDIETHNGAVSIDRE